MSMQLLCSPDRRSFLSVFACNVRICIIHGQSIAQSHDYADIQRIARHEGLGCAQRLPLSSGELRSFVRPHTVQAERKGVAIPSYGLFK